MKDINGKEIELGQLVRVLSRNYVGNGDIEEIDETYVLRHISDIKQSYVISVEVIDPKSRLHKFRAYYKELMWQVVLIDHFNNVVKLADDYGYMTDEITLDDVVLLQSTGLISRHSEEIFNGDIVQCWYDKGYVVMHKGSWVIENDKGYLGTLYDYLDEAKVVGNIYQNPDLLN